MALKTEKTDDTLKIYLNDRFDFDAVEDFREAYKGLSPKQVTVDFSATGYMDSSGLGMLLNMHRTLGEHVNITLAHCQPAVKRILIISRFENFFTVT